MKARAPLIFAGLFLLAASLLAAGPRKAVRIVYDDGTAQELATSQPTTSPTPPTAPTPDPVAELPPLSNGSRLGVNLDWPNSSSTFHLFADAMKSARRFSGTLDANGWPLDERSTVIVWAEQSAADGTYLLLVDNPACKVTAFNSGATEIVPRAAAGEFFLVYPKGPRDLWLKFEGKPGRVRLIRPDCKATDLFTPAALDRLAPFGGIRTMDLTQTNASQVRDWAGRPTLDAASYAIDFRGAPIEVVVALANQTGKEPWFCIPHAADDDYVARMGALVRSTLRPDLGYTIEYSNEVWNWKDKFFVAYDHVRSRVRELKAAGDTTLDEPDGKHIEGQSIWRYVARRTLEIRRLWAPPDAPDPRVKFILCSQYKYGDTLPYYAHQARHQLLYLERVHQVAPASVIDAIGLAPYGGIGDPAIDAARVGAFVQLARAKGLRCRLYEFGTHNTTGGQAMLDRHAAPEAFDSTQTYLNNLFDAGVDDGFWFVVGARWWAKGDAVATFGAMNGMNAASPKYRALVEVANERQRP